MLVSASEISVIVNGEIVGNKDVKISAPSKIEEAKKEHITFLANPKYEPYAYSTKAGIILVNKTFKPTKEIKATLVKVDDVYTALGKLLNTFGNDQNGLEPGVSKLAEINIATRLGESISIGAFCVVKKNVRIGDRSKIYDQVFLGENVQIGADCVIYPGVKIYPNTEIGHRCVIHSNTVIGSDGFGFSKNEMGEYEKIAQIGKVVIEDDVEIGSNTVIDRATMGVTTIRKGVKLDNLIQIGHNVDIGEHSVIAAQAGVAGSTKIGRRAMIGGQAGFVGHIKVADGVQVQAQSGVMSSIDVENDKVFGSPAIGYVNYLKSYAAFKNLPELLKKIKYLELEIESLRKDRKD